MLQITMQNLDITILTIRQQLRNVKDKARLLNGILTVYVIQTEHNLKNGQVEHDMIKRLLYEKHVRNFYHHKTVSIEPVNHKISKCSSITC